MNQKQVLIGWRRRWRLSGATILGYVALAAGGASAMFPTQGLSPDGVPTPSYFGLALLATIPFFGLLVGWLSRGVSRTLTIDGDKVVLDGQATDLVEGRLQVTFGAFRSVHLSYTAPNGCCWSGQVSLEQLESLLTGFGRACSVDARIDWPPTVLESLFLFAVVPGMMTVSILGPLLIDPRLSVLSATVFVALGVWQLGKRWRRIETWEHLLRSGRPDRLRPLDQGSD